MILWKLFFQIFIKAICHLIIQIICLHWSVAHSSTKYSVKKDWPVQRRSTEVQKQKNLSQVIARNKAYLHLTLNNIRVWDF